jgi:hypothetical protein
MAMPSRRLSEDDGMNQGDVVHARKFTRVLSGPEFTMTDTFSAPKGQQFVFLYLGWEPRDGSKVLDVIQVMKDMGWTPPAEIEQVHQQRLALSAKNESAETTHTEPQSASDAGA